jgi:hypothetical protein
VIDQRNGSDLREWGRREEGGCFWSAQGGGVGAWLEAMGEWGMGRRKEIARKRGVGGRSKGKYPVPSPIIHILLYWSQKVMSQVAYMRISNAVSYIYVSLCTNHRTADQYLCW